MHSHRHDVAPDALRTTLRARTTDLHQRLDHLPDQRALMAPGLDLPRYMEILARHAAAHRRCEARLGRWDAGRPADLPPYASRVPALRADLAALAPASGPAGWADRAEDLAGADPSLDPHELEGAYLGLRYVLDGATQGARFIAARLSRSLPELLDGRFAFWRLQEAEAGTWAALVRTLETRPGTGRAADAAVAAARDAYGTFLAAFDRARREPTRGELGARA